MKKKLYHGVAYYPETWAVSEVENDIKQMKLCGINLARLGEFAWSTMEPEEGDISLDFFTDIINRLCAKGIESVFCVPTATPPVWISHNHPERMHVDYTGTTMTHGSRQHVCTNNAYFRKRAAIITEAIAQAFEKTKGIVAWQIDNELKGNVSECLCETCGHLWHDWLAKRYKTIKTLNESWGTAVWSQTYSSFDQVPQPLPTPSAHNPSLATTYRIFQREKAAEFQDELAAIIRRYSKSPITHNSSFRHYIDHNIHFKNLDFASFDDYHDCDHPQGMVMHYDFWRNIKSKRPFWVMETSPSHNGCVRGYRRTHRKGYLKAEAVAAYASGAESFCYWLWRQHRTGVEMPHGAILNAWGTQAEGFNDVAEVGRWKKRLEPLIQLTTPKQPQVAVVYSDIARAFFMAEPLEELDYLQLMSEWHSKLLKAGIPRDLIPPSHSLDGYSMVMTPFLPHIPNDTFENLKNFVESGGTWIVGPLTGFRTEDHTANTDAALGKELESLAGVETMFMFSPTGSESTGKAFGEEAPLSLWSSFYKTDKALSLGEAVGGLCDSLAFITERNVGDGKIVMLGSLPTGDNGNAMINSLFDRYHAPLPPPRVETSPGIIKFERENENDLFQILVDMDGNGGWVNVKNNSLEFFSNAIVSPGNLTIEPYGTRCLIIPKHN